MYIIGEEAFIFKFFKDVTINDVTKESKKDELRGL